MFSSGGWAIVVVLNIVATPYFVYKLSIEGYGVYALLTGLIGCYGLLELGLGQGVIKFVSEYRSLGDDEGVALLCRSLCARSSGHRHLRQAHSDCVDGRGFRR